MCRRKRGLLESPAETVVEAIPPWRGELSVTELADTVGMKAQAVSNQLGRLIDQHILAARRDGNRVYYRIADPCVTSLLELGLCLTDENC